MTVTREQGTHEEHVCPEEIKQRRTMKLINYHL